MSTAAATSGAVAGPDAFDAVFARVADRLELADGRRVRLPVRRWHAAATATDGWLLQRCTGPTLDLGCGPGRLTAALVASGVTALGIDQSVRAVRLCRARRVPALCRDVFAALPGEGFWSHALLADGNLGIGGDPVTLLRRAADLLVPGGSVLVETDPSGGLWRGSARLRGRADVEPWFPWATVGPAGLVEVASAAGLLIAEAQRAGSRAFAQLVCGGRG